MNKNLNKRKNIRIYLLFSLFLFEIVFLSYRQISYQFYKADDLEVLAKSQYKYSEKASDLNYLLLDCNGKNLLNYKEEYHIVIDPVAFKNNYEYSNTQNLFSLIYLLRNYNRDYDVSKISLSESRFRKHYIVDKETYEKISEINNLKGVYCYIYHKVDRNGSWSIENLISNIKRTKDNSFKDENSLEMLIDRKLKNNQFTYINFEKDVAGEVKESNYSIPKDNLNLRLTIDKNLQNIIRETLNIEKYKKYNEIGVVVMESETGKIKALAQNDEHNPNIVLGSATENGFEPGSIFKVIIEEAALDRNIISSNDYFTCDSRTEDLCKDHHHGTQSLLEAFVRSCNNTFWDIGEKVKFNNYLDNAKLQGLFNKVLNFDSEVKGDWVEPEYNPGSTRQLAIGQSMRITPIQALSIVNTVVTGGEYIKPYIIDAYVDNDNEVVEKTATEKYKVINKKTAEIVKNQMRQVVISNLGTGKAAYVNNIETGGKTGTPERIEIINNEETKKNDGWFIGYFKLENKYYSMVVYIRDIGGDKSASNTAAPLFSNIVNEINKYSNRIN